MGAVFPPAKSGGKWRWCLFAFGANPIREGSAKDEATAKEDLSDALALTLAAAGLCPITSDSANSIACLTNEAERLVAFAHWLFPCGLSSSIRPFASVSAIITNTSSSFDIESLRLTALERFRCSLIFFAVASKSGSYTALVQLA